MRRFIADDEQNSKSLSHLPGMRRMVPVVIAITALIFSKSYLASPNGFNDTCQSFIKTIEEADETMDQTQSQKYDDIAESIYAALNDVVMEVGLSVLPLPQDENSKVRRSMLIVRQCRKDMALLYHNAVADVYVELRKAASLPTELPTR